MQRRAALASIAAFGLAGTKAIANPTFPNRPVRFIIPSTAGGILDLLARSLANTMPDRLGQAVIVENRPGGQQIIAANAVARAIADGHTILMATSVQMAINPHLLNTIPYDAKTAFEPITMLGQSASVIAVLESSPFKRFTDLIDFARKNPDKLSYASAGIGTSGHMAAEMLRQQGGLDYRHIPYAGNTNALNGILGGQVDFICDNEPGVATQVRAGRLRPLAISSSQRSALLKDVPAIAEFGFPEFDVVGWFMACAPAHTPQPIIQRLNEAIVYALNKPETRRTLAAAAVVLKPGSSEAARNYALSEYERWGSVIKNGNIHVE